MAVPKAQKPQVSIDDFLAQNVDQTLKEQEIEIPRFKSHFRIKELTSDELDSLKKESTRFVKNPNTGLGEKKLDDDLYAERVVAAAVVVPDLNNKDLQASYGTLADPAKTLRKMLKVGEFNALATKVTNLSNLTGFNLANEVKQVKK